MLENVGTVQAAMDNVQTILPLKPGDSMNKPLLLCIAVCFVLFSSYANAECSNALQVRGEAKKVVKPDIAYVTLYAQADGILMEDAVKKADKLVADITAAVKEQTTIIRKIDIEDFSLGETQSEMWRPNHSQEPPRPQVTKKIRLSCDPVPDKIYQIIDLAIRAGAVMHVASSIRYGDNSPSVVAYGAENVQDVLVQLEKAAIVDARSKADNLAHLAGKQVDDVVGMGCSNIGSFEQSMRIMGQLPDFPTKYLGINPKEIEIVYTISMSYSLK